MSETVRHDGDQMSGAAMIGVAASLRWSRPDLTAELAGHVADAAGPGDPAVWLTALGWRVHGVAAVGDGRAAVVEALEALDASDVDPAVLAGPAGQRLLVEIASACRDNGDVALARRLAEAVLARADASPEARFDARLVLARCAGGGRPEEARGLFDSARADARLLPGHASVAVALARSSVAREGGRTDEAVDAAREGLQALGTAGATPDPVSPHLVDALTAQHLGALLEAGRGSEARAVAEAAAARAGTKATRQAAQLRLVIAQATADHGAAAERALSEAAEYAAAVDSPGLEGACRVALGDLAEKQGRLDAALAATRAGLEAEHRDVERGRRFRELVAAVADRLVGDGLSTGGRSNGSAAASVGTTARSGAGGSTQAISSGVASGPAGADRDTRNGTPPARATAEAAGATSAIDALLGGLDAGIVPASWSGTIADPLAEPRPVGRRRGVGDEGESGGRRRRGVGETADEPATTAGRRRKADTGATLDARDDGVDHRRRGAAEASPTSGGRRTADVSGAHGALGSPIDDATESGRRGEVKSGTNGRAAGTGLGSDRGGRDRPELLDGGPAESSEASDDAVAEPGSAQETPAKPRRRATATAVPIEEPDRQAATYGALLGDALISELRASGRWSDDGRPASWPRLRAGDDLPGAVGRRRRNGAPDEPRPDDPLGPGGPEKAEAQQTSDGRPVGRREDRVGGDPDLGAGAAAGGYVRDFTGRRDQGSEEQRGGDPSAPRSDRSTADPGAEAVSGRAARRARAAAVDASTPGGAESATQDEEWPAEASARAGSAVDGDDRAAGAVGGSRSRSRSRSRRSADRLAAEDGAAARRVADLLAGVEGGGRAARRRAREAAEAQTGEAGSTSPGGGRASGPPNAGERTRGDERRRTEAPGRAGEPGGGGEPGRANGLAGRDEPGRPTVGLGPEGPTGGSPHRGERTRPAGPARAGAPGREGTDESRGIGSPPRADLSGGGRSSRVEEPARSSGAASSDVAPSPAARAADDWLRSAIAELDRVWGKPDALSGALPAAAAAGGRGDDGGAGNDGEGLGTSVVLDFVDGDRRIGSPDVERVLRGLSDRMRVHLPSRARVRTEDPSTVRVDLPGRDRSETAAWLHPVLRDLASSVTGDAGLRGARLRGTVHGTDGATGVQLIQDIEPSPPPAARSTNGRTGAGTFRLEDLAVRPGSGGRRHRRSGAAPGSEGTGASDDEGDRAGPASPPSASAATAASPPPAADGRGSTTGSDEHGPGADGTGADGIGPGSGPAGGDTDAKADTPAANGGGAEQEGAATKETPTEALGLGDLLAGAMAAYRGL
ncbi:hypothetical protein LWC35_15895 [Pseudonocardia kujensis]|uniref:hypothetical protein n=1 Tax=Pseudonocardia kujensis TaxID=1128675 RepID=UPI001E42EF1C|nr:hypothetical protein [Pseudonocardia kujensis]MCE0764381.1 hypothetical protein [Pseudonocardia kujensis]